MQLALFCLFVWHGTSQATEQKEVRQAYQGKVVAGHDLEIY
jgi:hypothetical protein